MLGFAGIICTAIIDSPSIDITSKGLENFTVIFKGPIWFLTSGLALFALRITMSRMEQTEKLISISNAQNIQAEQQFLEISKNNLFNNYFIYKEHFINFRDNSMLIHNIIPKINNALHQRVMREGKRELDDFMNGHFKTYYLEIFAFFFGDNPNDFILPYTNEANKLLGEVNEAERMFSETNMPIKINVNYLQNGIAKMASELNNIENYLLIKHYENESFQFSEQDNLMYWHFFIIKEMLLFINQSIGDNIERFLSAAEQFKNHYDY